MTSFRSIPSRIAATAYEASIEDRIVRVEDLYDLDGETFLRSCGGRIETGSSETFEREVW
jgi:hypothetical protein